MYRIAKVLIQPIYRDKIQSPNVLLLYCRLISFAEFQAFEAMLCTPDAMYALSFLIFDTNGSGYITYGTIIFLGIYFFCMLSFLKHGVMSLLSSVTMAWLN